MDIANVSPCHGAFVVFNWQVKEIKLTRSFWLVYYQLCKIDIFALNWISTLVKHIYLMTTLVYSGCSLPPQFSTWLPWSHPQQQLPRGQSLADQTHLIRFAFPQKRRPPTARHWRAPEIQKATLDCPWTITDAWVFEACLRDEGRRCVQFCNCTARNHVQSHAVLHRHYGTKR